MSQTKHTPGPWVHGGDEVYSDGDCINGGNIVCDAPVEFEDSYAYWGANAKLICAAPELLEACIDFVNKVESGAAKSTDSYAKMKAAISKATT
jgi:hypothetical protein